MLNFDKYREKIEKLNDNSLRCGLAELRGVDQDRCDRTTCECCALDSLQWLVKEYKPPLLENGDGLKPGDWIMVSLLDGDTDWRKLKFVVFHNGYFYTESNVSKDLIPWKRARLPEEGETR